MNSTCKIRPATPSDVTFVAQVMAEAVGLEVMGKTMGSDPRMQRWMQLTEHEDTLYSYRNALLIADEQDCPVAGLISYPGEGYLERRRLTFDLVKDILTFDPEEMDAETKDGEYYLDSLAVLPQMRGNGLGSKLLQEGIRKAHEMGRPAILACSPDNPQAHRLYESLGFVDAGSMFIFGETYIRMVNPC